VHQTPLNPKQMLKDVMQFDKLGLERVSGCPIGLIHLKFGVFLRWSLVQVMQVYEVAWGKYLGMGACDNREM
jgi:hypothetical protein